MVGVRRAAPETVAPAETAETAAPAPTPPAPAPGPGPDPDPDPDPVRRTAPHPGEGCGAVVVAAQSFFSLLPASVPRYSSITFGSFSSSAPPAV
ncbi:hypothetical protein GCM10009613_47910 [Pseudonocardia kongjuensis]|uniref:Uncharacterized protein n=1 Tax=Pseudonocardia kongjuensis TaxID=102227 RepID=A0ABP4IQW7_9PSEU